MKSLSLLLLVLVACGSLPEGGPGATATSDAAAGAEGLEHYRKVSDRLGQGGQPAGEVAFRSLAAMGYRTLVSVDGAIPDVEAAARHGMRYVHVPVRYHGIRREEALLLIQASRTSDGPVYVHCHHGLHRGPAAAVLVLQALEGWSHAQAVRHLETSGCSPKYKGLYRDAERFRPPTDEELAALPAELPSKVVPDDIVGIMVEVNTRWEHLVQLEANGWGLLPKNPDVQPPHEALMLREQLREMARLDESREMGADFVQRTAEGERASADLENALRAGDRAAATEAYRRVEANCASCHQTYRNNK
ncbi:MAG: cytochrome c [Planctomycetaceae bacterium]